MTGSVLNKVGFVPNMTGLVLHTAGFIKFSSGNRNFLNYWYTTAIGILRSIQNIYISVLQIARQEYLQGKTPLSGNG